MDAYKLITSTADYVEHAPENRIQADDTLRGESMFSAPIFAFADASDPLFKTMREPAAVGPHFLLPHQWLDTGATVISCFFPFSEALKASNRDDDRQPSLGWCIGRIEGQEFLASAMRHIQDELKAAGFRTCIPAQDPRFSVVKQPGSNPAFYKDEAYRSNWSERHVGFICGMGTFGLSGGLITRKGMAGRLGSVVTEASIPATRRDYIAFDEYCIHCGACARRCPAQAISLQHGKKHPPCSAFLDKMKEKFAPRFGCGKCQTGVPCESAIPRLKDSSAHKSAVNTEH